MSKNTTKKLAEHCLWAQKSLSKPPIYNTAPKVVGEKYYTRNYNSK